MSVWNGVDDLTTDHSEGTRLNANALLFSSTLIEDFAQHTAWNQSKASMISTSCVLRIFEVNQMYKVEFARMQHGLIGLSRIDRISLLIYEGKGDADARRACSGAKGAVSLMMYPSASDVERGHSD